MFRVLVGDHVLRHLQVVQFCDSREFLLPASTLAQITSSGASPGRDRRRQPGQIEPRQLHLIRQRF